MIAILSIHIAYTKTFVYIQLTKLLLYWRKIEEPLRNRGIAVPFGISSTWFRKRGRRKSAFLNNISTSWLAFMLTLFSPAWPLEEQINCTQERLLLRLNCSRVCVMVQHQAKEQCDHVIGAPCNLFNTLPKHLRLGVSLIDLPSAYLHHVMNEVSLVDQTKPSVTAIMDFRYFTEHLNSALVHVLWSEILVNNSNRHCEAISLIGGGPKCMRRHKSWHGIPRTEKEWMSSECWRKSCQSILASRIVCKLKIETTISACWSK